jgi:hypothetical protein
LLCHFLCQEIRQVASSSSHEFSEIFRWTCSCRALGRTPRSDLSIGTTSTRIDVRGPRTSETQVDSNRTTVREDVWRGLASPWRRLTLCGGFDLSWVSKLKPDRVFAEPTLLIVVCSSFGITQFHDDPPGRPRLLVLDGPTRTRWL